MELANQIYGANSETEPQGPTDEVKNVETTEPEVTEPVEATPELTRRVTTELDGREIELEVITDDVDLDLIPKSLMMEKAFRQKTMSLADDRRALEEKVNTLDQKLLELSEQIQYDMYLLESDEMKKLKEYDPDEFEKERLKVEKKLSKFKSFQEERGKEILDQQNALKKADREKIPDLIPEWLDEKVAKEDYKKISSYLVSYGIKEDEVDGVLDNSGSVTLATLRKAALYDEIQSAPVEKNVSRKAPKTSTPNSTSSQENSAPKREKTYAEILYGE